MLNKAKKWISIFMVLFLAITTLGVGSSQAGPAQSAPIRLQADTFNPGEGEAPQIPPGLTISGYAQGQTGYYIVQFMGPVQQAWKDQVTSRGASLLDYIPDFAFKVRMNPAQAARTAALESVNWVGIFQPAYKLSPDLKLDGIHLYRVSVERGVDSGQATAAIARSGALILDRSDGILLVSADPAQVQEIAHVLDVAWVENYVLPEKHNEFGGGVIMGANSANTSGYDGSSQIVAVSDTGLGSGTAADAHPDIPASRIENIFNWPGAETGCFKTIEDDGPQDVDSGHGTHTSVSVLGDGGASGEGKGVAPAASLVFQATENWATITSSCVGSGWPAEGYFLTGLPDDLRDMYQQAYNEGARIHSNSWGAALAGRYTLDSANTDDFIWDNPDMTITFSAGNNAIDSNANGVVDNDSLGSPGTAKNVITVGASENDRDDDWPCDTELPYYSHDAYQPDQTCSDMGDLNLLGTWGQRYGSNFPVEPLYSDLTAGNAEQMAAWSSRGPTDDGRIKPDVVAPGTWILSGYSGLYQEGYGGGVNPQNGIYQWDGWGMPMNEDYKYMGGTSMSNPLAAGAATVVRDYYQKDHEHNASAALIKASLINSAVDLLDENNDGANDNDFPIPNVHEGWGRVDLAAATNGSHQFIDNAPGVSTGGSATYQISVVSNSSPFKVSLVWSDFASTETAAVNLVNDLDLVVTDPDDEQYRGNMFSGGWSQTDGIPDRVNNVENIYIQSPAVGTWTVAVSGFNVPNGPQPFALVVDGDTGTADTPPSVTITNLGDGATVSDSVTITAVASDDNGVEQVEFFVDGGSIGVVTGSPYSVPWDSNETSDGSHSIRATATDNVGLTGSDSVNVTVDNVNDTNFSHVGDIDGSSSKISRNWQAQVTITIHDTNEELVSGAQVIGTWSADTSGSDDCTTDSSGTCTITSSSIPRRGTESAIFTVDDVNHSLSYSAADNHDPDGDSSGTVIQVNQDGSTSVPDNQPPTASFTYDCNDTSLSCDFDASGSSDTDGSIVNYEWDFGDSGTDTGVTTSHTYNADGSYSVVLTVTDDGGAFDTADQQVIIGNTPPTASFTYTCNNTLWSCDFNASGSSDTDGSIVSYEWEFGDSSTGTGVTTIHNYDADGSYSVVLTVTDDGGASDTAGQQVIIGNTPTMHVADLDGSSELGARNRWNATVAITVHDSDDGVLAGATVSGSWSAGATGSASCVTEPDGQCSIIKSDIKKNSSSVTFSVTDVTSVSNTYDAGANHDPDGDSDGTNITVPKP